MAEGTRDDSTLKTVRPTAELMMSKNTRGTQNKNDVARLADEGTSEENYVCRLEKSSKLIGDAIAPMKSCMSLPSERAPNDDEE